MSDYEARIASESVGAKGGVKSIKGVHNVQQRNSTAGTGAQRVGIYLPGTWRIKSASIKNPNAVVLEAARLMIQYGGGEVFDADAYWQPLRTGECDDALELTYEPEDKIVRFATVYGEVTHGSSISHTLSVMADKINEGDEQTRGSPKPIVNPNRPSLLRGL